MRRLVILFAALLATPAFAGPVVLGGDDLNCHGDRVGGNNIQGWLYIQAALTDINSQVTRPGPFTVDIAMLGSPSQADCPAVEANCDSDANDAAASAAANAGLSISYFDGAAAIQTFFNDLTAGTVNPRIIYLPGTDCEPDLDEDEGDALVANAARIQTFVASGGGLLSHGCDGDEGDGDCAIAYGWLSALNPGLTIGGDCESDGAMLTAAGQAALPGLTNSDIDDNAGPCHNTFGGNLGTLQTLAVDDDGESFILGGLIVSLAGINTAPVVGFGGLAACAAGLAALAMRRLRKQG